MHKMYAFRMRLNGLHFTGTVTLGTRREERSLVVRSWVQQKPTYYL